MPSRRLLAATAALLLAAGARAQETRPPGDLLSRSWEHKLISSGDNFPTVNLRREHRADLVLLLHERTPPDRIRARFGWSEADLENRLQELEGAGIVRRDGERYLPTVMVLSVEEAERHLPVSGGIVDETVAMVERVIPDVRRLRDTSPGLTGVPYERISLLLLSDVLLDNWQINAVEERFLGAERPLRDGKRYYFSLQERDPGDPEEAFGIYGNEYRGFGPFTVGVYGNRRSGNPLNFATLDEDDLVRLFGDGPDGVDAFKQELLTLLAGPEREMTPTRRAGFEAIGWMEDGRVVVPLLRPDDHAVLEEIAGLVTDRLVGLLERHRPELERHWRDSPYGEETTFEEYLIWWYHLYYTAVTDRLARSGLLAIPASGITSYVLTP